MLLTSLPIDLHLNALSTNTDNATSIFCQSLACPSGGSEGLGAGFIVSSLSFTTADLSSNANGL
jgi:hypothetical protein